MDRKIHKTSVIKIEKSRTTNLIFKKQRQSHNGGSQLLTRRIANEQLDARFLNFHIFPINCRLNGNKPTSLTFSAPRTAREASGSMHSKKLHDASAATEELTAAPTC